MATRITPCPKCKQEGESELYLTERVCPLCEHEWSVAPFPPEVLERLKNRLAAELHGLMKVELPADRWRELADSVASVIADYLRSDATRSMARHVFEREYRHSGSCSAGVDAVIAALLKNH